MLASEVCWDGGGRLIEICTVVDDSLQRYFQQSLSCFVTCQTNLFFVRCTSTESISTSYNRGSNKMEVARALQCSMSRDLRLGTISAGCTETLPPSTLMKCYCRGTFRQNFKGEYFPKGKKLVRVSMETELGNSGSTNR